MMRFHYDHVRGSVALGTLVLVLIGCGDANEVDYERIVQPSADSPVTAVRGLSGDEARWSWDSSWIKYGCEVVAGELDPVLREWVYAEISQVFWDDMSYGRAQCSGQCVGMELEWDGVHDRQIVALDDRKRRIEFENDKGVAERLESSSRLVAFWNDEKLYGDYDVSAAGETIRDRRQVCQDWSEVIARRWRRIAAFGDADLSSLSDTHSDIAGPYLMSPIVTTYQQSQDPDSSASLEHWLTYGGCGEAARVAISLAGPGEFLEGLKTSVSVYVQWDGKTEEITLNADVWHPLGGSATWARDDRLFFPARADVVSKIMASRMIRVQLYDFDASDTVVLEFDTSDSRRAIKEACADTG